MTRIRHVRYLAKQISNMAFGVFVSNENKSVFTKNPQDLSFSSDYDMYKIHQEQYASNGELLARDHALNYFPFFLAYRYSTNLTNGRRFDIGSVGGTAAYVSNWSYQVRAYAFIAYNFGVR